MNSVTRLFMVVGLWSMAGSLISAFVSAWLWKIQTGLVPIILLNAILFTVMIGVFHWFPRWGANWDSRKLMGMGILFRVIYVSLLLILRTHARQWYPILGLTNGLAAGFYWLALFVLTSLWVSSERNDWYNGWMGVLETGFGVIMPAIAGYVIASMPGLSGYHLIFLVALILFSGAWTVIMTGPPQKPDPRTDALPPLNPGPSWPYLLWSIWALGLRDGVFFLIPALLIYIITNSPVWLGLFTAGQAVIQSAEFYLLSRWIRPATRIRWVLAAAVLSIVASAVLWWPMSAGSIYLFGMLIAVAYPPCKVAVEAASLDLIGQSSHTVSDRMVLTGQKEVWINWGRLAGICLLLAVVWTMAGHRLLAIRYVLSVWGLTGPVIVWAFWRLVRADTSAQPAKS